MWLILSSPAYTDQSGTVHTRSKQDYLEDPTCFFIDEARDTLDSASASQTSDGWLGDTLDVVTQHLPVTFSTTLSKAFASLAASRHCSSCDGGVRRKDGVKEQ